ncbi:LacI family DNA-binding transcriptional regulator [Paenibacillus sp. 1001270B_150601_E10]|uniref:LacI family DNA-binding transcriptional regulator n=1 Tax=Paenibacillus sp. 1001270B_150601_E10 TaxID=2787079 RepID=UPI00189CB10B|nr:LacI family DNA-binding transcriptional regulator [Paenibacillus sp. 1001270B_150601_E10]
MLNKITSKQIAEQCGVTRGTVDRALNNRPGIKAETRARILKAAEELGYRPDYLGQSLVKGETKTLGMLTFDMHNPIFAQLYHAFEDVARQHGYFVYLALTHKDKHVEQLHIHHLMDRRVDGLALNPINEGEAFVSFLHQTRTPIVTYGNRVSRHIPHVWINDQRAVQEAVQYMAAKGYQHILYVSPPLQYEGTENIDVPKQRYVGLQAALQQLPSMSCTVLREKHYIKDLIELLPSLSKKTAILCTSDIFALEILKILKQPYISVPDQIGIMGFDNIGMLEYVEPALTTVDYTIEEIGRSLAETLIQQIQGVQVNADIVIPHRIIERASL